MPGRQGAEPASGMGTAAKPPNAGASSEEVLETASASVKRGRDRLSGSESVGENGERGVAIAR